MSIRRDYKPDSTWQNHRRLRLHGLLVITLVVIGLFGSLLAYIRSKPPLGVAQTKPTASRQKEAAAVKPADTSPATSAFKPKYEFYKVLPERKLIIANEEAKQHAVKQNQPLLPAAQLISRARGPTTSPQPGAAGKLPDQTAAPARKTGHYILHAGSFRNPAEADERKASLVALGVPARIETVTGTDGGKMHRVRVGPLSDAEAKTLRQHLQKNHIPISLKIAD